MELFSADIGQLKDLIDDWAKNPEVELEATFGVYGTVDMQTFLRVISRLKSKGYSEISQQDSLTIGLEDSVRFTLKGEGPVKRYCEDDTIVGKDYIAIIKDRSVSGNRPDLRLQDYDVKIKSRRELPYNEDPKIKDILAKWGTLTKYFRLIRRWTFHVKGVKFDVSMVRSTPRGKTMKSFKDVNILAQAPVYEIEVELNREEFAKDASVDEIYTKFVQGIGEILRGIQASPVLIRKSTTSHIVEEYKKLTRLDTFRGVAPVTLGVRHMLKEKELNEPNIRDGYNVTDKADGLRAHGFTDTNGELFMIDMSMNVYRTGLKKAGCGGVLLDGEYVTSDKHKKSIQDFLLFDIYYYEGKDVSQKPFEGGRYEDMKAWMNSWSADGGPTKLLKSATLQVCLKTFFFAKGDEIFSHCKRILDTTNRNYHTDGVILTPNASPLPSRSEGFKEQFKWKPAEENTVDFLVKIEKDLELTSEDKIVIGIHPETQETIRYKILRLLVSSRDQQSSRDIILNKLPLEQGRLGKPRPVLFNPSEYPDLEANLCYLMTDTDPSTNEEYVKTEAGEPIRTNSIVEMRYDTTRLPGWRWIPMRLRVDKTERYAKGVKLGNIQKTMNSKLTADDVWLSIHYPVTRSMICNGTGHPTKDEQSSLSGDPSGIQTKYREKQVDKKDKNKVQSMLDFHNKYIKMELLYGAIFSEGRGKKLLDMTVGEASDLNKWIEKRAEFVLGVDLAGDSILNEDKGAYKRLLKRYEQNNRNPVPIPPIFFVIGNSSLRLKDGSAGATEQDKNILQTILGQRGGPVPPLVEEHAGELSTGVDSIVCMYAIHYFFETETIFDGFLKNIDENLKVGGLFVGTNFDGGAVFDFLRRTEPGKTRSGVEDGSVIYELTKLYDADELPTDSSAFGMGVDVKFITIGKTQREYLVPWELLVSKLRSIGCEPVGPEELATMGLKNSTNMYKTSYEMMQKNKGKKITIESGAAKDFSFLNRWYIFKRISNSGEAAEIIGRVADESQKAELEVLSAAIEKPVSVRGFAVEGEAPVEAPVAAAAAQAPAAVTSVLQQNKFKANQIYSFSEKSPAKDTKPVELPDKYKNYAARWMAPNAPFPIMDTTDSADTATYPSITHFLAAMKFKYATGKPERAGIFASNGQIHSEFLGLRVQERAQKGTMTEERHYKYLEEETARVESDLKKELRKANVGYNVAAWDAKLDEVLRAAIKQRLLKDKWFCVIVDAVVKAGKYLLYQDTDKSILGGVRKTGDTIAGENRYGRYILEMATTSPEGLKACIETGKEPGI